MNQNRPLWEVFKIACMKVKSDFKDRIWLPVKTFGTYVRDAGLSIKDTIVNFVNMLKDLVLEILPSVCRRTLNTICSFLTSFVGEKIQAIINSVCNYNVHQIIVYSCNIFLLALAFALPSDAISTVGRVIMCVVSCVSILAKTLLGTAANVSFVTALLLCKPISQNFNVRFQAETEFRSDFRTWLQHMLASVTLTGLCVAGMEVPSDKKSLDELLRRTALVGRSYQTWTVLSEHYLDLFDHTCKIICKYLYGREYCSVRSIPDVEWLFFETMKLCRQDEALKIHDPDKTAEIEHMYILYHEYLKIYGNDPTVRAQLHEIGKVLAYFHKQILLKNPKAYVMRQEPVCVVFHGATGVGKSYLMTPLQQDLCKIAGVIGKDGDFSGKIYSRCVEHEFWDGYSGQPIVLYDDFAQQVDSQQKPNSEFFEIIRTVNIFPYQLHSAALEEKANNAFRAKFVVCTTNAAQFNVQSIIEPEAFKRRMHLLYRVDVIDEVRGDHGLDGDKLSTYRHNNNLPLSDMSHYVFVNEYTNEKVTYANLVVAISNKYKKHYNDFLNRQVIAKEKENEKLPSGAFSVDSHWLSNDDQPKFQSARSHMTKIPYPVWCVQNAEMRFNLIQKGYAITMDVDCYFDAIDMIEDSTNELVRRVERSDECAAFNVNAFVLSPQVVLASHRLILRKESRYISTAVTEAEMRQMLRELVEERSRIGHKLIRGSPSEPDMEEFAADERRTWAFKIHYAFNVFIERTKQFLAPIAFGVAVLGTTFVLFKTLKFFRNIARNFVADKVSTMTSYSKCDILRIIIGLDLMTSIPPFLLSPVGGFMNAALALSSLYDHYLVHWRYEEGCDDCKLHLQVHKEIVDKIPNHPVQFENLKIKVNELKTVFQSPHREGNQNVKRAKFEQGEEAAEIQRGSSTQVIHESSHKEQGQNIQRVRFEDDRTIRSIKNESLHKQHDGAVSRVKFEDGFDVTQQRQNCLENGSDEVDSEVASIFSQLKIRHEAVLSEQCVQIAAAIRRNMYDIRVHYTLHGEKKVKRIGITTILKGHKALINFHFIQYCGQYLEEYGDNKSFKMIVAPPEQEEGHEFSVEHLLTARPVMRGEYRTEFYIWTLPKSVPLGKDITKHLIHPDQLSKLYAGTRLKLVTYDKEDTTLRRTTREGDFIEIFLAEMEDFLDAEKKRMFPQSVRYAISTIPGDCGGAVLINSTAFSKNILGFHFAGIAGHGICSIITYKDVEKHLRKELNGIEENSLDINKGKIEFQSEFILPMKGSFQQIGSTSVPIVQPCYTQLQPSLVYGFFGPSTVAPALLRPALEESGPMLRGISKNNSTVFLLNENLAWEAVTSYMEKLSIIPSLEIERKVLTYRESCAGIIGEKHFPPLKRSKSAGWPWMLEASKGKTDWLGSDSWDFESKESLFLESVVNQMEEQCRNGQVPEVYFVDTLKDEKRALAKVEAGKTRTFSAAPMHFSILFRKYFLGFIAYISRTRYSNECAVGTNVYSEDWKNLVSYMMQYGEDSFTDGDFENFDGTILYYIFDKIIYIVNRFYGDSEQNQRVRSVLWEIITRSPHIVYNIVYFVSHGQPSGNPATAPFNSLYVSLLMRYVYGALGFKIRSFNSSIKLMTYGDDFILSIPKRMREGFNGKLIAQVCRTLGVRITNAQKEEHDGSFVHISELTFLKRKFVYDKKLKWWFAPLELQSIIEMCNWTRKTLPNLIATTTNVDVAQYELFHHSEDVYEEVRRKLEGVYQKQTGKFLTWRPWNHGRMMICTGEILEISENLVCI